MRTRFHRGHLEALLTRLALAGVLKVHEGNIFAHEIRMDHAGVPRALFARRKFRVSPYRHVKPEYNPVFENRLDQPVG